MLSRISVLVAALLCLMILAAPPVRATDFVIIVQPSPPEKTSDREVLACGASNPSAIGCVSAGADLGLLKVLTVANSFRAA